MGRMKRINQLEWITDILERNKINYLLDSGTLLGIIREGDIIKYDNDIDLAIFEKDTKKVKNVLEKLPRNSNYIFIDGIRYEFGSYAFTLKPIKKGLLPINIHVFKRKGNNYETEMPIPCNISNYKDSHSKFKMILDKYIFSVIPFGMKLREKFVRLRKRKHQKSVMRIPRKFFDKKKNYKGFLVPYYSSQYLAFRYGKDWKTPDKNWNFYKDDKSLIKKI